MASRYAAGGSSVTTVRLKLRTHPEVCWNLRHPILAVDRCGDPEPLLRKIEGVPQISGPVVEYVRYAPLTEKGCEPAYAPCRCTHDSPFPPPAFPLSAAQ